MEKLAVSNAAMENASGRVAPADPSQRRRPKKGSATTAATGKDGGGGSSVSSNKSHQHPLLEQQQHICPGNYMVDVQKGCYVAHYDAQWLVGVHPFDPRDFGLDEDDDFPDISIDPETNLLSVVNQSTVDRSFYISLGHPIIDASGQQLAMGSAVDAKGVHSKVTTLILVVKPRTLMDVAYVIFANGQSVKSVQLKSDVKNVSLGGGLANSSQSPLISFVFPLPDEHGPWLCTQGFGGYFTHFNTATYHALDFRCPVGTPVLAIGDGVVVDIQETNRVSGIDLDNFYVWNSLMLQLDGGGGETGDEVAGQFAEYVHISAHSAVVKVGERVKVGQVLCLSGEVGFCPEPHLHLQLHASASPQVRLLLSSFCILSVFLFLSSFSVSS